MNISFLSSGPGILLENKERILIFADLHMGIESDLECHGIHIQNRGVHRINRIIASIKLNRPDRVILLGDVKHRIPGISRQESIELPDLFQQIRAITRLGVSLGNHDPGIQMFLADDELYPASGIVIDGIGYIHGHTRPDKTLSGHLIITGHHHPTFAFRDEVGVALRTNCYLLTELDPVITGLADKKKTRALFIPACNELVGYGLERTVRKPFSLLSKAIVVKTAEVLLPDGIYAGSLQDLLSDNTGEIEEFSLYDNNCFDPHPSDNS